jgi:riboflavin-specific deaminase-like protein
MRVSSPEPSAVARADRAAPPAPARFTRLLPAGEPVTAAELVDAIDLPALGRSLARRPYVVLNMVATVDGRATIEGRSGKLSNRGDRELFHALRGVVDGILVGAGTIRTERYGPMIRDDAVRRRRVERGLSEQPLACIVSGLLQLPPETPLLADTSSRVVIVTPSAASVTGVCAHVDYIRAAERGTLDLARALSELRERHGVDTLLCEGGPHLNAEMLAAGLVDELFLSLSPKLAGGEDATGEALRIVAGADFDQPLALEPIGVLANDSQLFLRYAIRRSARDRS